MEQALTQPENLVSSPQNDIDKMFSGLGIDPFAFNSKPEKSETTKNNDASSLSIEDKQRYQYFLYIRFF